MPEMRNTSDSIWIAMIRITDTPDIADYSVFSRSVNMILDAGVHTYQFVFFAHVLPCLYSLPVHGMQLSKVTLFEVSDQHPFLQGHLLRTRARTHTAHARTNIH